ncbi:Hypothetical protein SMAX5B_000782, partial [Scophthalmus maximus]
LLFRFKVNPSKCQVIPLYQQWHKISNSQRRSFSHGQHVSGDDGENATEQYFLSSTRWEVPALI